MNEGKNAPISDYYTQFSEWSRYNFWRKVDYFRSNREEEN